MIAIIGAMNVEINALRDILSQRKDSTVSGILFSEGVIDNVECVVAVCGIGKVNAARCTQTAILLWKPELIINIGVAGSLTTALPICGIAVADSVVQYDYQPLDDPIGCIDGIGLVNIPTDEASSAMLEAAAKSCNIPTQRGVIATGDRFVNDPALKAWLKENFTAIACEMEGAAVGHTAYISNTPYTVLRAMSDAADDTSPLDFPTFVDAAVTNSVRVLRRFFELYSHNDK